MRPRRCRLPELADDQIAEVTLLGHTRSALDNRPT
jgi:hypothetical protein